MKRHEQALLLLGKAEEDEALLDEVFGSGRVSDTVFGFHCQQTAEKLLKAILSELGTRFGKTHNLKALMDQLQDVGHGLLATAQPRFIRTSCWRINGCRTTNYRIGLKD